MQGFEARLGPHQAWEQIPSCVPTPTRTLAPNLTAALRLDGDIPASTGVEDQSLWLTFTDPLVNLADALQQGSRIPARSAKAAAMGADSGGRRAGGPRAGCPPCHVTPGPPRLGGRARERVPPAARERAQTRRAQPL